MNVADAIKEGVAEIPKLALIGDPTFVISFRSDEVDVFHVNNCMKTRGWYSIVCSYRRGCIFA